MASTKLICPKCRKVQSYSLRAAAERCPHCGFNRMAWLYYNARVPRLKASKKKWKQFVARCVILESDRKLFKLP